MISFTVYGKAQPAGSKRAFALRRRDGSLVTREGGAPVINVTDDNAKSKSWKQEIAKAALAARGAGVPLLDGPLRVWMGFCRVRPKGHTKANGELTKAGRGADYPTTKPDVLKLARAAEDAMTGILYRDDAQIVDERLVKMWGEREVLYVNVEVL